MSETRRMAVAGEFENAPTPNAALLLQRGIKSMEKPKGDERETPRDILLNRVTGSMAGDLYAAAFARRSAALAGNPLTGSVELRAPAGLAVGLGNESVLEVGLTLLHPYGVPYIPGSALKGLARRHAARLAASEVEGGLTAEQINVLFGQVEAAGYTIFHDAWYVPESAAGDRPLAREVVTTHHPKYYMKHGGERRAPWDFDDPNPVGYVTARGSYRITVEGPTSEWAEWALALLRRALAEEGAGGKTNAGFGRLYGTDSKSVLPERENSVGRATPGEPQPASTVTAPQTDAQKLMDILEGIPTIKVKQEIGGIIDKWRRLGNDEAGRLAAGRAMARKMDALNEPKWTKKSTGYREVRAYLEEHGQGQGESA